MLVLCPGAVCWARLSGSSSAEQPSWRACERLCLWWFSCSELLMGLFLFVSLDACRLAVSCPEGCERAVTVWCQGRQGPWATLWFIFPSLNHPMWSWGTIRATVCVPHWVCATRKCAHELCPSPQPSGKVTSGCWLEQQLQVLGARSGGAPAWWWLCSSEHDFVIMQWLVKIIMCLWRDSWKWKVHCSFGGGRVGADSPLIDSSHDVPVLDGRIRTREEGREFANKYADRKTLWLGLQISSA